MIYDVRNHFIPMTHETTDYTSTIYPFINGREGLHITCTMDYHEVLDAWQMLSSFMFYGSVLCVKCNV